MRRRNLRLITAIYLLLGWTSAPAQSYFFSTLSTRDGLPSNVINSITQDKYDFLWVGTSNGLARYDGHRFKTFKRDETNNSIPANEISALLVDNDFLWVGTWRGLCKINTRSFEITRIDVKGNSVIRTLYKDKSNTVWVGTANGLLKFNADGKDFIRFTAENSNLSHNMIRAIHQDARGNLWVGTYDQLNKLKPGAEAFENFDLKENYNPALKNNLICDIKPVKKSDSLIWVGTETGLCLLNIYSNRSIRFSRLNTTFSNEVIKNIYSGPEGELWLGTDFGLNLFDPETKKSDAYFHNPQIKYSIANNVIWQIFEDSGGVIWLVTSNGLSKANKYNHLFEYHEIAHRMGNQMVGNQVRSILFSRKGLLWIATIHGVLSIDLKNNTQKIYDIESRPSDRLLLNNVGTLEEDHLGRIWIGTAGGINVWDDNTQIMHSITANAENGLTSNYIARFIKGADGSFWISAWEGGLFKIVSGIDDLSSLKFEYVGDFGSQKNTYAMNALWSVSNNELYRIDLNSYSTKKIEAFNIVAKGKDLYNLYYSPKGSLWAGTLNGLLEYKANIDSAIFHPVITGSDIELNNITSDDYGNLWAAADRFILKFSPSTRRTEIFPLDKELPLKTFNTDCSAKSPDGELLFGGDNGYIKFSPQIKPNNYQPNLFLTSLEVNNKTVLPSTEGEHKLLQEDISFTHNLVLPYTQRSLTFEFSSLHFWQPEINVYAYKLEGFDDDWKYVSGSKNFAIYSNLPARSYTFKVRGTNNYGIWSDQVATLGITIKPPLFISTPFLLMYALVILVFIIAGLRVYTVRLKLKNDLKIAVLEKEHAEEIVLTKQQFFTSISHELRTPISLIIPPIQQILKRDKLDEDDKKLITLAEKNSQRLLRLINQILDYRKLEHENQSLTISWFDLIPFCQDLYSLFSDKAARNEIDFIFRSSMKECPIWADKEKIEIIVFNLLSNAFKFTPRKGKIEFIIEPDDSVSFADGAVRLSVSDSGIGISENDQKKIFEQFYQTEDAKKIEDGSGIGLTLVAQYTKIHRGEIRLLSNKGSGSTFSVFLPLGSSHFPVDKSQEGKEITIVATKPVEAVEQHYAFNLGSEKPLILLVEDNTDMIDFITLSLKNKYNFVSADNGESGLQKAMNILPAVIISDIMMPVMDGLEFCQKIKQDVRTSHIPIILLTAKSLTSQKIEGIRKGADTYITKPFEVELLEAHIDHLLERKAELAQYFKHELITQPASDSRKENEDDKFLKKVMNAIEVNIANPDFSVEILSEEMGMSSTHLYRKLKSLTHFSANEIIKKYRIKKASLLLKNKEGNISEIMYEVGFSNLSYFSKCFKTEFGLTPKEYQQKESKHSFDIEQNLKTDNLL
jgi:signal transduction histidine kinase/ligand-binding sensor domain-containing protein/DNA-binding response OmpR family regulator